MITYIALGFICWIGFTLMYRHLDDMAREDMVHAIGVSGLASLVWPIVFLGLFVRFVILKLEEIIED